jgi:hypothetical protein
MTVPAVNTLFKTLGGCFPALCPIKLIHDYAGCTVAKLAQADLKRLGLPDSAGQTKRAVLKVPLTFPKPRAGKKKGRGA